ncbi:hypothetical protein GCM10025771_01750 [Niveibacterium umoris]|uniref:Uncharacterized protein n=1 Tax=Niveibacterium umoris TaxID=1193620 RepID=A0A840BRI4_9RHOO|nr:hypothetical protein [Niveibacterium umoris]MBB4014282.1 hypothetical protein [Niveibacterium umoris]
MTAAPTPDRRRDDAMRAKVDAAFLLIAPFFEPANQWAGHPPDMLAYRTLRDHMPNLDAAEAHLIVGVARRIANQRRAS